MNGGNTIASENIEDKNVRKSTPSIRRRGRASRIADRTSVSNAGAGIFRRAIPFFDAVGPQAIAAIESHSFSILETIGIEFRDPLSLDTWRQAGADVSGQRVRIDRALILEQVAKAPERFIQHARNPARSVAVGGPDMLYSPVYGPPFVRDLDGHRRYARFEDLQNLIKLAFMAPGLNHSGGTVCEAVDIDIPLRHLYQTQAHLRLSDKPFMGVVTAASQAADCLEMCRIAMGEQFVAEHPVLMGLVNCNSPLVWDETMLDSLRVYAQAGQPIIVAPFLMQGASTPSTMAAVIAQNNAEALACIAYAQLVRPGTPVVYGCSGTTVSMRTGAPMNASAEAQMLSWCGAALGRHYKLPTRVGGMRTSSPTPDAQAAYESAQSMLSCMLAGGNVIIHSAGWLEGGLSACYAKFVMDADQTIIAQRLLGGFSTDEESFAMDAFEEVGPGGQFFGCAHTQRHFKDIFFMPESSFAGTFEQWEEEGSKDIASRAREIARTRLQQYEPPPIDPAVDEALEAFIERRTQELMVN